MWKFFTVLIFMLTLYNVNYAQQTPLPEGEDDDIVEPTYFFLDDNCEGNMAIAPGVSGNLNPLNAFKYCRFEFEYKQCLWLG